MMEELCHRADPENQDRLPYIPVHLARPSPHWHTVVSDTFPAPEMARNQNCTPKTPYCALDLLTMAEHALWYQQQRCNTLPVGNQL